MTLRKPLHIFFAVIKALFLRELEMRMSVGKIGLFWTFFEPFFQVFILVLIKVAIVNSSGEPSSMTFDFAVFMASGFIAFNMFQHILISSMGAFAANKGLLSYKQVKPIDTIIARTMIELFLTSIIIMIFLIIGFFLQHDNLFPKNTLMVFAAYLWLLLFSFSVGFLAAVGNAFFVSVGKFVRMLTLPLLILSAVLYPLVSLSPLAQEFLLYNPLAHFMEMIHSSYVYGLDNRFVDYRYMLLWTIVPLFIGLWLYSKLEKEIVSL